MLHAVKDNVCGFDIHLFKIGLFGRKCAPVGLVLLTTRIQTEGLETNLSLKEDLLTFMLIKIF